MLLKTTTRIQLAGSRLRNADSERGANLVEYGLLVALIAVVCVAAVTTFGGAVGESFEKTASSVSG